MKSPSVFLKETYRLVLAFALFVISTSAVSRAQVGPSCSFNIVDFPGAYATALTGVNDKGQVVGEWSDSTTVRGGFVWMAGKFLPVSFPHSTLSWPTGINNKSDIVGDFITASSLLVGQRTGFVFSHGQYRELKVGKQTQYSYTADINDAGDIIGVTRFPYLLHQGKVSYFWFPKTSVPTTTTYPSAINNLGWIVGSYVVASPRGDEWHGFLIRNDEYISIDYPGATFTRVNALNDAGFVLGIWANDETEQSGIFVWHNGVFESSLVLFDPAGISDNGWIAGSFDRGWPASEGVVGKCR